MPLVKRFFYIPCRGEECLKLAEVIREKVPAVEQMDITVSDAGLYITMFGYETDVKNAWKYLRHLIGIYRSAVKAQHGVLRVKVEYLVAKIRRTFPPRLLVEILKRMGFRAEFDKEAVEIKTNAPLDKIEELTKTIVKYIDEIKFTVRGTTTKYYVVSAAILSGLPVSEVLSIGLKLGHLKLDEDDKYVIQIDWRQALSDFIAKIRSNGRETL